MPQRREASSRPTGGTSSAAASASLTPVAHRMQQAVLGRLSGLRASRHAGWMQTSAVGSHEHACTSTAGVVAHCAAVPHRCPSAGDGVHPALPEHVGSDCSATRGSFQAGVGTPDAHERELDGQRAQRERREHARTRGVPAVTQPRTVGPFPSKILRRSFFLSRRSLRSALRSVVTPLLIEYKKKLFADALPL